MNGLYLTIARWVVFASVALGVYLSGDSKYGLFVIYLLVAVVLGLRIFDRYKKISKPTKGILVSIIASAAMAAGVMVAILTLR